MNSSGVTRRSQRIMQNGNPSDFEEDEAHPQGPAGSLEQLNISCHQMKWQEYQRSVMTTENEFDMILATRHTIYPAQLQAQGLSTINI